MTLRSVSFTAMPTPTGSAAVAKFPRSPAAQSPCSERAESGYTGDRAAHKKHGTGVQVWADGCRYEGEFVDDLKHDFGVFTWANGEEYRGEFFKDYRHGKGTYSWPGGTQFTGKFYLNRKEGYGTLQLADRTTFQGLYRADERFGPGVMRYPDGRQDVGLWHRELLVKLCTHLPGAFTLRDYPEHCWGLGEEREEREEATAPAEQDKDPFYYRYKQLLQEHDDFVLPPGIAMYSTDADHLPQPHSLRTQLDSRFSGGEERGSGGSGQAEQQGLPKTGSCTLMARIQAHIHKHSQGAEGLGWDVGSVLSADRSVFGPPGPLELQAQQLIEDARQGNYQSIYRSLRDGLVHPDLSDASGNSTLMTAAVHGHNDVINILLDNGADVDKLNDEGMSVLSACHVLYYTPQSFHGKMAKGTQGTAQSVTKAEEMAEPAPSERQTGGTQRRSILVRDGRVKLGNVMWQDSLPLAEEDSESEEKEWLKAGGLVGEQGQEQEQEQEERDREEFDSARSMHSYTVEASERALQSTGEALSHNTQLRPSSSQETVHRIAQLKAEHRRRWATIQLLLCRGADPNASQVPMPVLFLAIQAKDTKAVRHLLECKARTDMALPKKQKGLYPLHMAAGLSGKEGVRITELLLSTLADPDVRAQDAEEIYKPDKKASKEPPPGFSLKSSSPSGPPPQYYQAPASLPEEGGRTPLHVACMRDSDYQNARDVVALLLKHKANPNTLWSGHSPLSLAVASGNDLAIEELLAGGADPNLPLSSRVGSVLCAAVNITYDGKRSSQQKITLLERLVSAGANILMPITLGDECRTAVGTAVDYGYYVFSQDWRIAHTPYHALTSREREVYNSRRNMLNLMGGLLRSTAVHKERERLEKEKQQGIHSRSPSAKFVYTGAGASALLPEHSNSIQGQTRTRAPLIRRPLFGYCYLCGRSVGVHLVPCSRCREVYYCSKSCKLKGWNGWHKEECIHVGGKTGTTHAKGNEQRREEEMTGTTQAKGNEQRREEGKAQGGRCAEIEAAEISENYSFN
ncbi:ankyrin repeat and MYND domain-containing protein 1 [Acipenser ruthenus]|uniref:ankyrin repeat and MYND domain-containing protein 1 n=1 Tax=Acipenser ruthenus TaxID=7906 RepID=UPI00155F62D1|nr:ankyrin repeat and MYND domain-containing protein 1 [Acipenser ruthenus]